MGECCKSVNATANKLRARFALDQGGDGVQNCVQSRTALREAMRMLRDLK